MEPHKEIYQGCEIEITSGAHLTINSKQIEYELDPSGKNWSSKYLPYSDYDSLSNLAKAIVSNTAEFAN